MSSTGNPNPQQQFSSAAITTGVAADTAASTTNDAPPTTPSSSVFPPPLVPEVLQYRLDTGNIGKAGGQRGSLTRCAQKFGTFRSKLITTQDAEAIETSKQDLEQELKLYMLDVTKLQLVQRSLWQELQTPNQLGTQIESEQAEIVKAKKELDHARNTKQCLQEYEAIAKLANESLFSQPKSKLQEQIQAVKQEIISLEQEMEETDATLKVRETQFQALMQLLLDMKRDLKDCEENDNNKNNSKAASGSQQKGTKSNNAGGSLSNKNVSGRIIVPMQVDEEDEQLYGDL